LSNNKTYQGRLPEGLHPEIEKFSESISFDCRLAQVDVRGSIAHAKMLQKQGIISDDEGKSIVDGLQGIALQIERGDFNFDPANEDVHMNIERALTESIGEVGGKLHTARSRNDQIALDIRLYLRDKIDDIAELCNRLAVTFVTQAGANEDVLLPGYTHLQRAQPVVLAHHLLAYEQMICRDEQRLVDLRRRVNVCPLGAAALAGTGFPIDREFVARELGFVDEAGNPQVAANSLDAVSDRDFAVEFASAATLIMIHLSRLSEEMILWTSGEFGFARLDDRHSTGSSIMPQKKNPDVFELIRGKTGRAIGDLNTLLVILKGLPLAYNRDLQEDKPPLFDLVDTVSGSLRAAELVLGGMVFDRERMRLAAQGGFSTATELADYLAGKGVPFRQAHAVAGELVRYAISQDKYLDELTLEELQDVSPKFEADVLPRLLVEYAVQSRESQGGTGPKAVAAALAEARTRRGLAD
jgi:argininosuccinate lyase